MTYSSPYPTLILSIINGEYFFICSPEAPNTGLPSSSFKISPENLKSVDLYICSIFFATVVNLLSLF